jgi:hypothetical protein
MINYIGIKELRATPMTRGEYNLYRGWDCPPDENPGDSGYLVEYKVAEGNNSNHVNHAGYISWSPSAVFDNHYRCSGYLSFSHALELLKQGHRVARAGWNGKSMFIFLVPGSNFKVNRPPLLGIYPEGTEIDYHSHIDMKTADNQVVPWLASQTDMLADDWEVVG